MSLIPYLMDIELRPRQRRLRNRLFGLDLEPESLLLDALGDGPVLSRSRNILRPLQQLASVARDVNSTIKSDKNKFQVNLDVQHFSPEEISVKTSDGFVIVEGKHEEREDDHGFVSRQFKRRYELPEDCNPDMVESRLSSDGVLTILAPKNSNEKGERAVPITHTGPVRRKHADDDENLEQNGREEEESPKTPQQKKRRR